MATSPETQDARRQHAIESATALFWKYGYEEVSIEQIVEATGLSRYALYHTFGDKKGLFLAVLEAYNEASYQYIAAVLERPDKTPVDGIYDAIAGHLLDPSVFPSGCLMCTTAVDEASRDPEVAKQVQNCIRRILDCLMSAYAKAQEQGLVSRRCSPEVFAETANALYFSTAMQARMGRDREELAAAIHSVADTLR